MADDEQPIPDDPTQGPAPTRGAGWDDDEWVRRDLGPRPEVPGHGARPFLMGIPILLIAIAAVVAIVVAGGGDDDQPAATSPGAATTTSGSGDASTERAEAALRSASAGLAGRADDDIYADATCEPTDAAGAAGFSCAYGGEGDPDSGTVVIRLQDDGAVTKVIGSAPPVAGQPSSTTTQQLLTEDDAATGASKVTYACA
ncbi:MAG: hypothetical protein JHD16_10455, partial [Solirubrobacteraceae bacterium]|nr:hypothetical protein [Solirubrobacteraceae bacterium]